ncbi:MAG: TAT-variant-translocated molybdopterin oxidoreductase [Armatimonadetes bacterium]|nr:TAT-variant-translocated molybdopterin oxidoreductase [Armatimonadota bacterium]
MSPMMDQEKAVGKKIDLESVEETLASNPAKKYYRSVDELAKTPEYLASAEDEFPNRKDLLSMDRRSFIKFMGASLALASLSGCRGFFLDERKVVPYVRQPEDMLVGTALYFASSIVLNGYATGVLVESHEGRPTKIEGNPQHPGSLGAANPMIQAAILELYDPDRSQMVTKDGLGSTWEAFYASMGDTLRATKGEGVRILAPTVVSLMMLGGIEKLQKAYPGVKWVQYEPTARDSVHDGAVQAFGQPVTPIYNFKDADVIVSLDGDFLTSLPGWLVYSRDFASRRRDVPETVGSKGHTMNRLYAFESTVTPTGAMADHRWGVKPSRIQGVAAALLAIATGKAVPDTPGVPRRALDSIVKDLKAHAGRSIVVTGDHQPAEVHAMVHALNAALGNLGKTVKMIEPVQLRPENQLTGLKNLVAEMNSGAVKALIILDGNPVFDTPADLQFEQALGKVPVRARFGLYADETSEKCQWHLPSSHTLEGWNIAKAYDGTLSIAQPLCAPLDDTRSAPEMFAALSGAAARDHEIFVQTMETLLGTGAGFEKKMNRCIHDGFIDGTAHPAKTVACKAIEPTVGKPISGTEVLFLPDPYILDGRFANLGWLMELPRPLTKVVWDNPALISPTMSKGLKFGDDDEMVNLEIGGKTIKMAQFLTPGQPEDVITLYYGFGRTVSGTIAMSDEEGSDIMRKGGFNVYRMRTSGAMHFAPAAITRVAQVYKVATTQSHNTIDDEREVLKEWTLAGLMKFKPEEPKELANLYPEDIWQYNGPQWGMTVDMNVCTGCSACVLACQAENNIPTVGKTEVARGRELHWLRIDRYYSGTLDNPTVTWQPVMCVHCEKAPCEPVCPVGATVHSHEGLNQMVYNRCVGTRYCSNNCPYKVRRFNYFNYSDNQDQFTTQKPPEARQPKPNGVQLLKMLNNPEVTVRGRGVMEKCTYCVQRINEARIEAKKQGQDPKDGDIITACQQACPTQAIVFGNIADKDSKVSKLRSSIRGYKLLEEVNTRPRTTHLGKVRNPNTEITA